jgi:hypothetical protein
MIMNRPRKPYIPYTTLHRSGRRDGEIRTYVDGREARGKRAKLYTTLHNPTQGDA